MGKGMSDLMRTREREKKKKKQKKKKQKETTKKKNLSKHLVRVSLVRVMVLCHMAIPTNMVHVYHGTMVHVYHIYGTILSVVPFMVSIRTTTMVPLLVPFGANVQFSTQSN